MLVKEKITWFIAMAVQVSKVLGSQIGWSIFLKIIKFFMLYFKSFDIDGNICQYSYKNNSPHRIFLDVLVSYI